MEARDQHLRTMPESESEHRVSPPPRPRCRQGKVFVTGALRPETLAALHELIDSIEETTGHRITIQKAVVTGLGLFYTAARRMTGSRRVKPPTPELRTAALPYVSELRSAKRLRSTSRPGKSAPPIG